jgi:hypothetical protein
MLGQGNWKGWVEKGSLEERDKGEWRFVAGISCHAVRHSGIVTGKSVQKEKMHLRQSAVRNQASASGPGLNGLGSNVWPSARSFRGLRFANFPLELGFVFITVAELCLVGFLGSFTIFVV